MTEYKNAVKTSRYLWWEWRKSGSPKERDHPQNIQRKEAKKQIRSEQRRAAVQRKVEKVEKIVNSSSDPKTFAKLINQQRKSNNSNVKALS